MQKITLRQLELFAAVAECGSFTRAAERQFVTQSTVSAQVAALETVLGARLLRREKHRDAVLTDAGRIAYGYARDILERCGELEQSLARGEPEKLRIGASSVPAQCLLPGIMAGFLAACGSCSFVLRKGNSTTVHEMLRRRTVRIGFAGAALDRANMDYTLLSRDRLVLITPNTERYRSLRPGEAAGVLLREPFLLREKTSGSRREFERHLPEIGWAPEDLNVVAEIDQPDVILESVASGVGVAAVSDLVARQAVSEGRLLSFRLGDGFFRDLWLVTRKDFQPEPMEREFIEFAVAALASDI